MLKESNEVSQTDDLAKKLQDALMGNKRKNIMKIIEDYGGVKAVACEIGQNPQDAQDLLDTINGLQETVFKYSLLKDFSTLFLPVIGLIIEKYSSALIEMILDGKKEPFYEVCGAIIAIVVIGIICCYVSKSWREEDKCKFYICLLKTKLERELKRRNRDKKQMNKKNKKRM